MPSLFNIRLVSGLALAGLVSTLFGTCVAATTAAVFEKATPGGRFQKRTEGRVYICTGHCLPALHVGRS
ncbi:hypothetical protein VTN77DRAFT_9318 [Rasamsonia byssochlamydoides]|uniref:uncharacterized protein n=1 Tax=Rasamsonia byssochlamydoides TaxID=89139 RepID=UPI0037431C5E